jgi:tetratricopeptide (TPR) repeat protein
MLAIVGIIAAVTPSSRAGQAYVLPTYSNTLDKTITAENLKAVASRTTDPRVLLGIAFLAQTGSPARPEVSEMAVKSNPWYAAVVAVIAVSLDAIDEKSVTELIKLDPDNALGYYLQGDLLYQSGKEKEALTAFRKAAACSELRLYESATSDALFAALDALELQGRDRLCALSWMATRSSNFCITALQPLSSDMWESAGHADLETRKEISDWLMILAGHLFATNLTNRSLAQQALESAFRLKAETAFAEKSPTTNGYVAVVRALVSTTLSWPGIEEYRIAPYELARQVPWLIHQTFAIEGAPIANSMDLYGNKVNIPAGDKAGFEKAKENAIRAAEALLNVALSDPDGIVGPYLKGLLPSRADARPPWLSPYTYVDKLMNERPDVFGTARALQEGMDAVSKAVRNDPRQTNMSRMMDIGRAILGYAANHDGTYPDDLDALFERKYLEPPTEAKSLLSDRPYVYLAAGAKLPGKSSEAGTLIVLYDDTVLEGGFYQCVFADGHGSSVPVDRISQQLKARPK